MYSIRGERSRPGRKSTTRSVRTAVWAIEHRQSLPVKWARNRAGEKALRRKVKTPFPLRLGIPQKVRDSHFPTASATTGSTPPTTGTFRMSYYDACGVGGQVTSIPGLATEGKDLDHARTVPKDA